jgi:hypothetical protein
VSLLDDLRGVGRHNSFGAFSLDSRKAQEKMREFQLVDPHEYVLQLVSAAVAGEASHIDIRIDGTVLELTAHGWVLEPSLLEQPLAGLFIAKDRPEMDPYRHFSIGVNALFALRPKEVRVMSGDRAARLDAQGGAAIEVSSVPLRGTRVTAAGRWTWRDALRLLGQAPPERALLEARAGWAPIPIRVNETAISRAFWVDSASAQATRRGMTTSGAVDFRVARAFLWLDASGAGSSQRIYVRHGVAVEETTAFLPPLHPHVAVYCDTLTTNASESGVVVDQTVKTIEETLPRAVDDLLARVCARFLEAPDERPLLRPRLLAAAALQVDRTRPESWGSPLVDLPLFTTVDGRPVSLAELHEELQARGRLRFTQVNLPPPVPRSLRMVRVSAPEETAVLEAVFKGLVSSYGSPADLLARHLNMARWRMGAPRRHVDAHLCLVTVPIADDGFEGEVGLPAFPSGPTEVTFVVGDRPLCRRPVECGVLQMKALVSHPDLSVNLAWSDVEEDEVFARLVPVLARAFEAACVRLAELEPRRTVGGAPRLHFLAALIRCRQDERQPDERLLAVPLVPTVAGTMVSIRRLREEAMARERLLYVRDVPEGPQMDDRIVVRLSSDDALLTLPLLRFLTPDVRWSDYRKRLESERTTLALERRESRKPEVPSDTLFPIPFKARDIGGMIGLSPSVAGLSKVRFLRKGKPIGERELKLGCDPLEAAIDSPYLVLDEGRISVLPGPAMDRAMEALQAAKRELARTVARALGGAEAPQRIRLASFLHAFLAETDARTLPGEIEACPLFVSIDGRPVSLLEIRASIRKWESVRVLAEEVSDLGPQERLTLVADSRTRHTLEELFGTMRVQDWTDGLRAERLRALFLARPIVGRGLPEGDYVIWQPFAEDGVAGQIGIPSEVGMESTVRVLHEERILVELEVDLPVGCRAVVWSPRLVPDRAFGGLSAENGSTLICALRAALERLISQLCAGAVVPMTPAARALMRYALGSVSAVDELLVKPPWSPISRAARATTLAASDGATLSVLDAAKLYQKTGFLRWVEPFEQGRAADDIAVLRLDDDDRTLLETRFVHLQSYAGRLEKDERRRAELRARCGVERVGIPEGVSCLVRLAVAAGDLHGEIGIPEDESQAALTLVYDGMALDRFPLWEGVAVVGMLTSVRFRPRPSWEGIRLADGQAEAIRSEVDRLFAGCGLPQNASRGALPRDAFFRYALARRPEWIRREHLDDASLSLPLFPGAGGPYSLGRLVEAFLSEGVIRVSAVPAAAAGDQVIVIGQDDDPELAFLRSFFGTWNVRRLEAAPPEGLPPRTGGRAAVPEPESLLAPPERPSIPPRLSPGGGQAGSGRAPEAPSPEEKVSPEVREPVAAPPKPRDPAADLLAAVGECFRAMALDQQYAWDVSVFERTRTVADARRKDLVRYEGALTFNVRHPLAARLLAAPRDPDHVALCASALFTAYNQALEEVTDGHEIAFMEDLLAWHRRRSSEEGRPL